MNSSNHAIGTSRSVTWQQAGALQLPSDDGSFDAVVCQFGAMFFPDKAVALAEVWRVLRPGGTFLFTVWDRIEDNEFAACVTQAMAGLFPDDPPRFLVRLAHSGRVACHRSRELSGYRAAATAPRPCRFDAYRLLPAIGSMRCVTMRRRARVASGMSLHSFPIVLVPVADPQRFKRCYLDVIGFES